MYSKTIDKNYKSRVKFIEGMLEKNLLGIGLDR
jgi:hypothetical protein